METLPILGTPLRPLHEKLGAGFSDYFGVSLPAAYVELEGECRTARESVALFDASYCAVFEFTGADRVRFLNAVTTNDIRGLQEGQGNTGLLLNPQGHILAELTTLCLEDRLLVLSHQLVRKRAAEALEKYIIMDDVTLRDITDQTVLIGVEGPQAEALFLKVGGVSISQMANGNHVDVTIAGMKCRILRHSSLGELGAVALVDGKAGETMWMALLAAVRGLHGGPIGYDAINALRLESQIPWFGYDFDDTVIPHEAGLEHSHISYTKGCYTGQEIVERVRSRGHVNRRRVSLQFLGRAVPESGARLSAAGKETGHVTSAAFAPGLGRVLGMGYVRREHSDSGATLEWSGGEAEVL